MNKTYAAMIHALVLTASKFPLRDVKALITCPLAGVVIRSSLSGVTAHYTDLSWESFLDNVRASKHRTPIKSISYVLT